MEFWQIVKTFISENSEFISLASLSFGFAGIILAFIFYRVSKPVRQLLYSTLSFCIISEKSKVVSELEVKFHGKDVHTLSITRIAIWNGGSEPLRNDDIPDNDPLIIQARDGIEILKTELIESTSSANRISIKQVKDETRQYYFNFDFLNPGDGATIVIIHSGIGIEDLSLIGTLIGCNIRKTSAGLLNVQTTRLNPDADKKTFYVESTRKELKRVGVTFGIISIVWLFISVILGNTSMFIAGIPTLFIAFGSYFYRKRKYPPSRLRLYDDHLR